MNSLQIIPDKLTKADIRATGDAVASQVLEQGDESPLAALVKLRAVKEALDVAIKSLTPEAMAQAEQWDEGHGKGAKIMGVGVSVRNGASRWDFSHDDTWKSIKDDEKSLAKVRKKRETFLKALEEDMVDPSTGEFVSPAVQTSMGNRALALTFPKGE